MKILIIDKYNYPRDIAQMDMYEALSEKYEIIFATPKNILSLITEENYDYLYLGIYHPWCGLSQEKLQEIININNKPLLIDQADNEGFIGRIDSKVNYGEKCILLSRYLPHEELEKFWTGSLKLLPWYINPDRFIPQEKEIDIAFVCTMNINRLGVDRKKMSFDILNYCENNNLTYKIGEYWKDYNDIVTKSKAIIIDGSRYCLTQKYIEAALSECVIIGEIPKMPINDILTISLDYFNINNDYSNIVKYNKEYILRTFANKEKFLKTFDNILLNFTE